MLNAQRMRGRLFLGLLTPLLIIVMLSLLNFVRGEPNVDLSEVWRAIVNPQPVEVNQAHFLIRELRIPRVLLALLCGMALGLVGVLLQDSLRNPLADPGLLGIAQGASMAMAIFAIYPELLPALPRAVVCLIAGTVSGLIVIFFSGTIRDPVRVILSGAIMSGFFGIVTTAVLLLAPYQRTAGMNSYYRFVTGSVSAAEWQYVNMILPWLIIGVPAALLSGRALNLLQLGDELATGAGLNPFRTRITLIIIAMLLISPVIAAIGPISFIALFAPHIARGVLISSDSRQTLIVSALFGAALLLAADTMGRLLLFPAEIPAGIWTVIMVGPIAIFVVGRLARRKES